MAWSYAAAATCINDSTYQARCEIAVNALANSWIVMAEDTPQGNWARRVMRGHLNINLRSLAKQTLRKAAVQAKVDTPASITDAEIDSAFADATIQADILALG